MGHDTNNVSLYHNVLTSCQYVDTDNGLGEPIYVRHFSIDCYDLCTCRYYVPLTHLLSRIVFLNIRQTAIYYVCMKISNYFVRTVTTLLTAWYQIGIFFCTSETLINTGGVYHRIISTEG